MNIASSTRKDVRGETTVSDLHFEISHRAYELYALRGYVDGFELDDWLQAEAELTQPAQDKAA